VRRVSSLGSAFFEVALFTQLCHKQLEETVLCLMFNQAAPKLGEHPKIEAWVGQFPSEQIFTVHARTDGICCLTVGQLFHVLHQTDQSQSPRGLRWLPSSWEQIRTLVILKNRPQRVS
jgi:hypothetical protein